MKQQLAESRERCTELAHQLQEVRDEVERVREEPRREESLVRDLEEARSERDRLGALVRDLEGRVAGDEGLAEELQAIRSEVERLRTELENAGSADERRAAVERARAGWEAEREALNAEALERARAECEAERRALQAKWDQEREALAGQVEQRVRMAEERAEAEHRAGREQAEAARLRSEHEREVLQGVLDRLQQEIAPLQDERETTRILIESLTREWKETTTFREQLMATFQEQGDADQARITQLGLALEQAIQEKDAVRQRGDELAGQVHALRAELERRQQDLEGERQQSLQLLAALQQDLKAQPQLWAERIDADRRQIEGREVPEGERDRLQQEIDALRGERETTRTLIASLTREREQLATFRSQLKASFQEQEKAYQSRLTQFGQALQQANQEKAAMRQQGNVLVGQVRELRAQLDRQSQIRDGDRRRSLPFGTPRPGPTINPAGEADVAVAETEVALAIAHTDVALSQLGSFLDHRK